MVVQAEQIAGAPTATLRALPPMLMLAGGMDNLGIAVAGAAVEHVLPMATRTPVPETLPSIVGVLNRHRISVLGVDPRPLLGLPTPHLPGQGLVIIRYIARLLGETTLILAPQALDPGVDSGYREIQGRA